MGKDHPNGIGKESLDIARDAKRERARIFGANLQKLEEVRSISSKTAIKELGIDPSPYFRIYLPGKYCPNPYLLSDMATLFRTHPSRLILSPEEFRNMMTALAGRYRIGPDERRDTGPTWDARFLLFIPDQILALRKRRRLRIVQASGRAGVQHATWRRYEKKTGNLPQTRLWPAIASALETTLLELTTPPDQVVPIVRRLMQDNAILF